MAIALARLGFQVGWISRLPDNSLGHRINGQIRQHGVDTSGFIWVPDERVGTYYVEHGRSPRPSNVIYDRKDSAFSRIQPDQVDWNYFRLAKWVHLTGITPALGDGPHVGAHFQDYHICGLQTSRRLFVEFVDGNPARAQHHGLLPVHRIVLVHVHCPKALTAPRHHTPPMTTNWPLSLEAGHIVLGHTCCSHRSRLGHQDHPI